MTTLPNLISFFRILLVPVFPCLYLHYTPVHALVLFLFAGLSDILDGFIARRYDCITRIGTVLDPLADKLMLIAVLGTFAYGGRIPVVLFLTAAFIELFLILTGLYLYLKKNSLTIPSNRLGKGATLTGSAAIVLVTFDATLEAGVGLLVVAILIRIFAVGGYYGIYKKSTS
ncbi:MAG: hypothetical protein AVO33_02350 [delta proteobacterium ML8_F1]|nr:MAG: hypothetical protein AVO33_02350 [delta proteobacterium ML8_F1]